eukprot:Skav202800  [mRNA]  locus=scaffold326:784635:785384:+ [translate_table: standard]
MVDLFSTHVRPRRFAIELFAGTGRVSQALHNVGIPTYPIDICLFPSHNVLDMDIHNYIRNLISSGRVILLWLGMPCTTFSRARRNDGRGPGPLRDKEHLWGLPDLSHGNQCKLRDGNQLFKFTMDILRLAYEYNIPTVLENPFSSMAWMMPPMVKYLSLPGVHTCDLDFCQYNERWQKPTRLVYTGMKLDSMALQCSGTHNFCSHSKRPHIALVGKDAMGNWWTRRAQPYPFRMVRRFAALALEQLRLR